MIIETKFSLRDIVYGIVRVPTSEPVTCPKCNGSKRLALKDLPETVQCFNCRGKGTVGEYAGHKWLISNHTPSKIGSVQANFTIGKDPEIRYMLDRTGVGSGTLWKEKDLFKTEEKARIICDERNK